MKIAELDVKKAFPTIQKMHPALRKNQRADIPVEQSRMVKKLIQQGWTYINSGYSSCVLANPEENYVIKINMRPDSAYDHFVNQIKRIKSKYLPKIHDRKSFITPDGKIYYVYLIEKLYPLRSEIGFGGVEYLAQAISNYFDYVETTSALDSFFKKYPGIKKTIDALRTHSGDFANDIHDGNIMQRKNGTPVIIDPYFL